ncbi:hypothetical protein [endosymbiont GvMRE of Glomus versiforme]|uniref:hypothetical protein n=1 Tax=endosymbiont GvMRE of Glomus versiforme TaxID=2039283 RepID=UPI000EBD6A6C|nr:hypothetical protein [endosymbiont GvMRE of Glomus versiforme]RHZ37254.1 hypothetical protein GvMRE_I1g91 [endosymbiont GvMRE of Glomus versiforme]RHZ37334.1 hypothetical protein GvMRE_I1g119 [endosymbiont GvMRE of Glomus versiforme]
MNNLWTKLTNWLKPKPIIKKPKIEVIKLEIINPTTKFKRINYKRYQRLIHYLQKEIKQKRRSTC